MPSKPYPVIPIVEPKGTDIPKFELRVYSIDYVRIEDPKELEKKHDVTLLNTNDVPINFNVAVGYAFSDDQKLVQCQIKITANYLRDKLDFNLAEFRIAFDYFVEDFASFNPKKNTYSFSNEFLLKISNISISTARGLMSSKFGNTYLHSLILPILVAHRPQ